MISTKLVKLAAGSSRGKLEATMIGVFRGGWRNAYRCKTAVKQLQTHLTDLKNSRVTAVEDLGRRVARFVSNGDVDAAFFAAEQIVREENTIRLHELLSESCQVVVANIPYIRYHSDCPNEINKAVSTLAFAARWCPDLPELQIIRELFFERYGEFFDIAAAGTLEGLHGSCVDSEVAERLALKEHAKVPYDLKLRKVCAIVKSGRLDQEFAMRKIVNRRTVKERPDGQGS